MIIDRSDFSASTGWTTFATNGTVTFNQTVDGKTAVTVVRTGAAAFDNLGVLRTSGVTGVDNNVYYVQFYASVGGVDIMLTAQVGAGATLDYVNYTSFYWNTAGGRFDLFGGGTNSPYTPAGKPCWVDLKFEVVGDVLELSARKTGEVSWNVIGTGVDTGYGSGTTKLAFNMFDDASATDFAWANYAATDDGTFTPPAPTDPAAAANGETEIDYSWTDGTISTVNADYISVEASDSSGSGFSEIDQVAVGVEGGTESGLSAGQTRYYKFRTAVVVDGTTYYSAYSAEVSATTDSPPDTDTGGDAFMVDEGFGAL